MDEIDRKILKAFTGQCKGFPKDHRRAYVSILSGGISQD